jgi:hypothetical protein
MPDLDQIKQAEQAVRGPARAVRRAQPAGGTSALALANATG